MTAPARARSAACAACGAAVPVGRRGPLPRRCGACRRRPVLPERAAGAIRCASCGAQAPVRGRRGRLPGLCPACRRARHAAAKRVRRFGVPAPLEGVRPAEWAALRPEEV